MCLPWPTGHVGDRRDPERRDQLVEHLLDRERRLRAPRAASASCRLTSVPKTKPGGAVELAGADQVVERGVDQVLVGVQVLDHDARSRRSRPRTGVPMLAQSRVRQPPTSGASPTPLADREHVGVLGVLEHAARAARARSARWNHSSVSSVSSFLRAGEAQEVGAVEGHPAGVGRERQVQRGDVARSRRRSAARRPRPSRSGRGGGRSRSRRRACGPCRSPAPTAPTAGRRRAPRRCRRGSRGPCGGWGRRRPRGRAPRSTRSPARSPSASAAGSPGRRRRSSPRSGSAGGLIRAAALIGAHRLAPRETLSIASAISSREACSEPSTSSTCSSATCSSFSGPAGSNQSATPVHWSRIA